MNKPNLLKVMLVLTFLLISSCSSPEPRAETIKVCDSLSSRRVSHRLSLCVPTGWEEKNWNERTSGFVTPGHGVQIIELTDEASLA